VELVERVLHREETVDSGRKRETCRQGHLPGDDQQQERTSVLKAAHSGVGCGRQVDEHGRAGRDARLLEEHADVVCSDSVGNGLFEATPAPRVAEKRPTRQRSPDELSTVHGVDRTLKGESPVSEEGGNKVSRSDWDRYSPTAMQNDTSVQIRQNDLTWREVDGEVIALDLVSSTYFTTNRTGTVLWRTMVDGSTVGELVSTLQMTFDLAEDVAVTDVAAFLKLLDDNSLLTVGG
jgi:hypothetical protein